MEFFVGDALAKGADVFVPSGGYAQSNHARIATAAARAAGLEPVIVVRPNGVVQRGGGNALLVRPLCDDVRVCPELGEPQATGLLRLRPVGASSIALRRSTAPVEAILSLWLVNSSGVMGYVAVTIELQYQSDEAGMVGCDFSWLDNRPASSWESASSNCRGAYAG
jgi:1-aminocyclopropane-1-carboxylate deaminase/D-cysteine desulfhydrase-like pyridoxal-dependent ACC family enzyme